ncbi:class I SAM-dependent methyltransferase [Thermodesulfobacteriota bacterium]
MHKSSILRMSWFVDEYALKINKSKIKILDVGSAAGDMGSTVAGESYKALFDENRFHYTGLDVEEGPNVDVVLDSPYNWEKIDTESYDVVISGQTLEHVEFFWVTVSEMARVLKKDGLMCIIVPQKWGEHRYPVDCFRFFTDGMVAMARYVCLDILHAHTNCAPSPDDSKWCSTNVADSMLVARKPYEGRTRHPDLLTYNSSQANHDELMTSLFTYIPPKQSLVTTIKWLMINNRFYQYIKK